MSNVHTVVDKKKILIVEDHPDVSEALAAALSLQNFEVQVAPDRDTAVGLMDKLIPDIVLLDYAMPGMGAAPFINRVRNINPRIPIVLMTAAYRAAAVAKELDLQHYLPKPFGYDSLLNLVRNLVPEAGASSEN